MSQFSDFSKVTPLRLIDRVNDFAQVQQNFREIYAAINAIDGRLGVPIGAIIPWWRPTPTTPVPDRFGIADGEGNRSGSGVNMLDHYIKFGLIPDLRHAEQTGMGGGQDEVLESTAVSTVNAREHLHAIPTTVHSNVCDVGGSTTIYGLQFEEAFTDLESTHWHVVPAHSHEISSPAHSHEMTDVRRVILLPIERLS